MEATAAGRGGPMPIPSQQSRKEWRAVSDHHSVRNVGDEVLVFSDNPVAFPCLVAMKCSRKQ